MDRRGLQAMALREQQWQQYLKIIEMVKYQDEMDNKPPELEPLLDVAVVLSLKQTNKHTHTHRERERD